MLHSISISQFVLLICCAVISKGDVPRPRGVSMSKAPLYSSTKDFTCFDGTITIPFAYVNDDYCDCFDGSDEPGTSACLNGVFHCTNAGYRPQNIPSSRINDGICDCCDGTDEYSPLKSCPNTCDELGKEARAEARRLADLHKQGAHIRLELIEQGISKQKEMSEQLTQLQKDKEDAEKIKLEKESLKAELEAKENEALRVYREAEEKERQEKLEQEKANPLNDASETFKSLDLNNDGMVSIDEIKTAHVFDHNKDGEVDDDEVIHYFGETDSFDEDKFISFKWEALKVLLHNNNKDNHDENEESEHEMEDEDVEKNEEDANLGTDDDIDSIHDEPEEPEQNVEQHNYDEETQKLVNEASEARSQYNEAERNVREIESNIRNLMDNLAKDYGPQQEFASLDGTCLDYEDKEYIYRLCFFQKVSQKPKSGGEISLGIWGDWVGEEPNKYSAMKYDNGVTCWNGPSRFTTVYIQCGLETKIISVSEPFRCEYKIDLMTPAACDESKLQQQHASHDEL